MEGPICYGTHDLMLGASHRIRLPGEVREQLEPVGGEGLVLVVGPNGRLWLYSEGTWRAAADAEAKERLQSLEVRQGHIDRRGRVVVPGKWRSAIALSRELTLVGVFDHWELWNRAEWYAHVEELDERVASIIESAARRE